MFKKILIGILFILLSTTAVAKESTLGVEWDDINTLNDLDHFRVYVCDSPIPQVSKDEFGAATSVPTCDGSMQTFDFPYKTGTSNVDITLTVTEATGSLWIRADVARINGVRSGLSNEEVVSWDYLPPFEITIRVRLK